MRRLEGATEKESLVLIKYIESGMLWTVEGVQKGMAPV